MVHREASLKARDIYTCIASLVIIMVVVGFLGNVTVASHNSLTRALIVKLHSYSFTYETVLSKSVVHVKQAARDVPMCVNCTNVHNVIMKTYIIIVNSQKV